MAATMHTPITKLSILKKTGEVDTHVGRSNGAYTMPGMGVTKTKKIATMLMEKKMPFVQTVAKMGTLKKTALSVCGSYVVSGQLSLCNIIKQ